MIESIKIFLPELFLSGMALFLLGLSLFLDRRLKFWTLFFSHLSLAITLWMVISSPHQGDAFGMVVSDDFSTFFKMVALTGGFLLFLLSGNDASLMGKDAGSYASLAILSLVGVMFLSSAEDLLIAFVGLELTTIPLFILTGFTRSQRRSSEAAIKFFLIGAFSTGLTLYGISLIYGICGSTHFGMIHKWFGGSLLSGQNSLFLLGLLFLMVGLGFKLSLVPFHQWVPDSYEGAPTPITAFFSISRDAGVMVILLRFFGEFVNQSEAGLTQLFMILSILTMTIGNIAALRQENLKRLLAYSSIAHAGTIFIGLVSGNQLGREAVMLYSITYTLMSFGAFAAVSAISRKKNSEELSAVQGLAKENFGLALLFLFFLIALAGIPPTLGFWGKFYLFASAIQSKLYWLVAVGLINSVVAVYYYFRIVHKIFFQEPSTTLLPSTEEKNPIGTDIGIQIAMILPACAILFLGIFPEETLSWIVAMAHL